ncbi:hypothetical protein BCR44DRAFT_173796 [Catenaria anguillulae PL171]|uniref:Uncharacterized protein n=1 Tax=Catenaria anguillulae PL171 TaxID=765915 RepID=A0A1Y2I0M6_9FUNG|nr:hypothetical protein BCR44DRAFT_173796 [Catenaria anguillulae PL171]
MTRPPKTSHPFAYARHQSPTTAPYPPPAVVLCQSTAQRRSNSHCPWRTCGSSNSDEEDDNEDDNEDDAASGASDVEGDEEQDEDDSMLGDVSAPTAEDLAWSKRQIDKYLAKSDMGEDTKAVTKTDLNNFAKASLHAKLMLMYLSVYTIKSRQPLSKEQVAEIKKRVKHFIAGPHVLMYDTGKLAAVLVTEVIKHLFAVNLNTPGIDKDDQVFKRTVQTQCESVIANKKSNFIKHGGSSDRPCKTPLSSHFGIG